MLGYGVLGYGVLGYDVLGYGVLGYELNAQKAYPSRWQGEFLRRRYGPGSFTGYPVRGFLIYILYQNPILRDAIKGYSLIRERGFLLGYFSLRGLGKLGD